MMTAPLCVTCHTNEVQEPFIHTSGYGFCSHECEADGNTEYGMLAEMYCGVRLPLQVCQSGAGYYIGTLGEFNEPYSRESDRYWATEAECAEALRSGNWPQKPHP